MSAFMAFSEIKQAASELQRLAQEIRSKSMDTQELDKPIAKELSKAREADASQKVLDGNDSQALQQKDSSAQSDISDGDDNTTAEKETENKEDGNAADSEEIDKVDSADDSSEKKDLTDEEIDDLQKKEIQNAMDRIRRGEKLTDAEKGNLGEMRMDQYYIRQGYRPIHQPRVTDLQHKSGQGIDGVYEKTNSDGTKRYIVADAKVNYSQLNKGLADGTDQMSDEWIDKRLDDAVGKEKADEIRDAYEDDPQNVSHEVYHYSYGNTADGSSSADIYTVDGDGNRASESRLVQKFDADGKLISTDIAGESANSGDAAGTISEFGEGTGGVDFHER